MVEAPQRYREAVSGLDVRASLLRAALDELPEPAR
jgi:hypothetical protein